MKNNLSAENIARHIRQEQIADPLWWKTHAQRWIEEYALSCVEKVRQVCAEEANKSSKDAADWIRHLDIEKAIGK